MLPLFSPYLVINPQSRIRLIQSDNLNDQSGRITAFSPARIFARICSIIQMVHSCHYLTVFLYRTQRTHSCQKVSTSTHPPQRTVHLRAQSKGRPYSSFIISTSLNASLPISSFPSSPTP